MSNIEAEKDKRNNEAAHYDFRALPSLGNSFPSNAVQKLQYVLINLCPSFDTNTSHEKNHPMRVIGLNVILTFP